MGEGKNVGLKYKLTCSLISTYLIHSILRWQPIIYPISCSSLLFLDISLPFPNKKFGNLNDQ